MAEEHFRILDDLTDVSLDARCAILVRHADRDGSLLKLTPSTVSINPVGEKKAREFGVRLRGRNGLRIYSSPVVRCTRTSECIADGYGQKVEIDTSQMIGTRGPFILKPAEAARIMTELGLIPFVDAYVKRQVDESVFMPCPEGTRRLLSWAWSKASVGEPGPRLMVTHDLILTPAMRHLFDYDVLGKGLIGFLDGFVIWKREGRVLARYASRTIDVTDQIGEPAKLEQRAIG
ncbi:MAG TPA: histidine phosphatase family protein [Methanomassiliicoccales archaeon]|nr:histidine phosphatase family protein [Methanomassiliicoccales archaeon]